MAFEDFLSATGHFYTVSYVHPAVLGFETVGHKLVITGTAENPAIGCISGSHGYVFSNLVYDGEHDAITGYAVAFPHSIGLTIQVEPGSKKMLKFTVNPIAPGPGRASIEPGSWTAEDHGPGDRAGFNPRGSAST